MLQARTSAYLAQSVHLCRRRASTASTRDKFKIVVVGGGSAGLSVAQQIHSRFALSNQSLSDGDILILDAAGYHYYQVNLWFLTVQNLHPDLVPIL